MVTLGEVLSLATLGGAIMGKIWRLWFSRLLENAFAAIVHLQILSDTDAYTKLPASKSMYFYANIFIQRFTNSERNSITR